MLSSNKFVDRQLICRTPGTLPTGGWGFGDFPLKNKICERFRGGFEGYGESLRSRGIICYCTKGYKKAGKTIPRNNHIQTGCLSSIVIMDVLIFINII